MTPTNPYYCSLATPTWAHFFDVGFAPSLLFYAYIPIIFVALTFGFYIYKKDNKSLQSTLLFFLTISFVLWVLNIILQWIAVYARVVDYSGQLVAVFEVPLFLFAFYFAKVFVTKEDVSFRAKVYLALIAVVNFVLVPTTLNVSSFDLGNCQVNVGPLWTCIYAGEVLLILYIICLCIKAYHVQSDRNIRKQIVYFTIAIGILLSIFAASNIFGEVTKVYSINLIGPIGMVVFLALMTYMIVRFKAFNVKLLATQALIIGTAVLIAARLFYSTTVAGYIISAITLVLFLIGGVMLNRSVKKEVEAREVIEGLAKKLETSNTDLESANEKLQKLDQQKSEFVSIASHQLRSPLTVIKGYLSMFLEGEEALGNVKAGTITQKGAEVMDTMFQSTVRLAHIIEDFLNVSRIEQGRMKYEMSDFDIRQMTTEVVAEFKGAVAQKGITIAFKDKTPSESYMVNADSGKLRQVIGNVIDNSIKYTPQGGITVYLERLKDSIRINIKDTGIGISEGNLKNLFQKFARATNAGKVNVTGSGLGLFVAIEIMKAHNGKLWAESEGEGKGSTFIIELPIVCTSTSK